MLLLMNEGNSTVSKAESWVVCDLEFSLCMATPCWVEDAGGSPWPIFQPCCPLRLDLLLLPATAVPMPGWESLAKGCCAMASLEGGQSMGEHIAFNKNLCRLHVWNCPSNMMGTCRRDTKQRGERAISVCGVHMNGEGERSNLWSRTKPPVSPAKLAFTGGFFQQSSLNRNTNCLSSAGLVGRCLQEDVGSLVLAIRWFFHIHTAPGIPTPGFAAWWASKITKIQPKKQKANRE